MPTIQDLYFGEKVLAAFMNVPGKGIIHGPRLVQRQGSGS
jgi:hypothetical protein